MRRLMDETSEEGVAAKVSAETTFWLRNPRDWSEEAIDFLSLTMTTSASKLAEHPFLKFPPQVNELVSLVGFALVSASRFYNLRNSYMRLHFVQ